MLELVAIPNELVEIIIKSCRQGVVVEKIINKKKTNLDWAVNKCSIHRLIKFIKLIFDIEWFYIIFSILPFIILRYF